MRLWALQLVAIATMLLVGWGVTSFPTARSAPSKLKQMCAAPNPDELARGACAEFSAG
jgi:hypothetical protein